MIDNVNCTGCSKALVDPHGKVLLPGSIKAVFFIQSFSYKAMIEPQPTSLLNTLDKVTDCSKSQYKTVSIFFFISVKSYKAKDNKVINNTKNI